MGAIIIFGLFAVMGLGAFIGSSYEPVAFWLQNGYWQESPSKILLGLIFLMAHGGIGFGGLTYLLLRPNNKNTANLGSISEDQPWLNEPYWSDANIPTSRRDIAAMLKYARYYFSTISIIAIFAVYESLKRQEYGALFGLLIPTITALLFYFEKKIITENKHFGDMVLTLNPYPGSIGGQLGGTITVAANTPGKQRSIKGITIELQCIRHTRSGKNSQQTTLWNETMIPMWKADINGHNISFSFDLNNDLREAQPSGKTPRIEWQLLLKVTFTDGYELKRQYHELPVFKTAQQSTLRDRQAYASESRETAEMHDQALKSIMNFQPTADGGYRMNYPVGRSPMGFFFILFGLIFVVVGLLIPDLIFNIFFPAIGGSVCLAGIYSMCNSLDIHINPAELKTDRYLFGMHIKSHQLASYDIQEFIWQRSMSTTTTEKKTQYYNIYAKGSNGKKVLVVEGVQGMGQARTAIERLHAMLKLQPSTDM